MSRALAALLSVVLTLLFLLLGAAGWLLLTTPGARWLAEWAVELEPNLALTVESGAIASGLEITGLSWQNDSAAVSAARATVEWTPGCLLSAALCLERVALSGLRVEVRQVEEAAREPPAQPLDEIRLPLAIRLQLLQLNDAQLLLPGTELALRRLQASGAFAKGTLSLQWLRAEGLDVVVIPAEPEPGSTEVSGAEPLSLPDVDLPLDLVLQNLLLENTHVRVGEQQLVVRQLALSGALCGSRLDLERLQLAAEPLEAELAGSATLAGGYPLALRLRAVLPRPELPAPLRLTASLEGSVEQLEVAADLSSPVALRAEAKLQPLVEGLPFELAVRWQQLAAPPGDAPVAMLRDGQLQAAGRLDDYRGWLATTVSGDQVPTGDWRLRFEGDLEQLRLHDLDVATLGGRLTGEGLLGWADGLRWQAQVTVQDLDPGVHWPDYPGRISGRLESQGKLGGAGLVFTATTPGIDGQLRDHSLALRGTLRKEPDDSWRFEQLQLASGDNLLELDGRLDARWNVDGRFRLADPASLLPELAGSARGTFDLRGTVTEPDIRLELQGSGLRYQDHALANVVLSFDLRRLGLESSRLNWTAGGVRIAGERLGRVRGELSGDRTDHTLSLNVSGADYGGRLQLAGGLDDQLNWAGQLAEAVLRLPPRQRWILAEPVALRWAQQDRQLLLAPHCWQQRQARLCLQEPAMLGERGALALALNDFHIDWLSTLLPQGMRWRAPLDGSATVSWQPDAPLSALAELQSRSGRIELDQEGAEPLTLAYDGISTRLLIEQNVLNATLELDSERLGAGRVAVQTDLTPGQRPLAGEVALDGLQLSLLRAFLPEVQTLTGTVSAHGRLAGTLQEPQFIGDVRLADGALAAFNLPLALTDIQLQAAIAGNSAELNGGFRSGDGSARLTGTAAWADEDWRLDVAVTGERLAVVYEPVARLQVSPSLKIRVQPQQVAVAGQVAVPSGTLTLRRLPAGAVAVSEDVVIINRSEQTESELPAQRWNVTTDIELVLGDAVAIEGYGLEGRLAGNLRLRQRPQGVPEATGELRIVDGRYEAYGQQLEIRQGQLLFAGPLREPSLNVEAVRQVDMVVAGLRVEGEPDAPLVTLFSEPGLPQEEILSYLIRGRPLGEGGEGGTEQLLTQAALSLGVLGGKGFASSLAGELGIRDFELGTAGEGEETQVELSGYLTPDLLVRYGIGVFEPVNTLTLRYRINDRFYVEAVSGLESALDFFYEFEF